MNNSFLSRDDYLKRLENENAALREEISNLKFRESQHKSILDTMSEVVERDSADLIINYANQAYYDFYGTTENDTIHSDAMEAVIPEDRSRVLKKLKSVTPEKPNYNYTCRIKNAKGELLWIEVFGHAFFDEEGHIKEYQDISRDITSYKSAEKQAEWFRRQMEEKVRERTLELSNANEKLSMINNYLQYTLNNISEGVLVIKEDGEILFLNYGSNAIWSTYEEALRKELRQIILYEDKSEIYRLIHQGENFKNIELSFSLPQGETQYLVSGFYINDENELPQGILILQPMAEMKYLVNKFIGSQAKYRFEDIVGESPIMKEAIGLAKRVAASDGNIMIEGESGTGKELFAQSIHNASLRRGGPFVAVNCGAIPRDLIASELFGYVEGSFTGAKKGGKPGKFEMAAGGTVFLDEIGDMPLEQQITLLRVLQERTVIRVGGSKSIPIDVRIICATNKDLLREVERGNFRQDLYYRLNVINLHIPPLRERKEDIPLMFDYFFRRLAKNVSVEPIADDGFLQCLSSYSWPGNVRELQNITERAFFVSHRLPFSSCDLPRYILSAVSNMESVPSPEQHSSASISGVSLKNIAPGDEKELILRLLKKHNHNVTLVAKEMNLSRMTLYRRFKKYHIEREQEIKRKNKDDINC